MFSRLAIFTLSIYLGSGSAYAERDFVCNTVKHTAIVDRLTSEDYRYRVWDKPKSITQQPDKIVLGGQETVEGMGPCRHIRWTFTTGSVEYAVSTLGCTESIPPEGVTGKLSVFVDGEHKKSWWCVE